VGIRRQLAASVYDAVGSGDAIERGKEAIKAKHVVGSLQGHRDSFPSTVSTQSLCPYCPLPEHRSTSR
jgi:hypothetical protein